MRHATQSAVIYENEHRVHTSHTQQTTPASTHPKHFAYVTLLSCYA